MFAASQVQTRGRAAAATKRSAGNENAQIKTVKDRLQDQGPVKPTAGVTRKRPALGDVSNLQANQQAAADKAGKVKAARSAVVAHKSKRVPTATARPLTTKVPAVEPTAKRNPKSVAVSEPASKENVKAPAVVKKESKDTAASAPAATSQSSLLKMTTTSISVLPLPVHQEETRSQKKAKTQDWDNLDEEDEFDPLMVSEYVTEIFAYMKQLEKETMPNPNYMKEQRELQWRMRGILVDWLIEVHNKFKLLPETLFLAVNIIDRFLSLRIVSLVKLQLVGITAMFIAAKYEEVIAPSIQNFIYMADGGYTEEEILKAERYVLQVLDFALQYPTPYSFLRRGSKADSYDIQTRTLAKYLMEISLIDHHLLPFRPSKIAAAALFLARRMLDRGEWTTNLVHYAGYTAEELQDCVDAMLAYLIKPMKYEALFRKYASKKFMKASMYVRDWIETMRSDGEFHQFEVQEDEEEDDEEETEEQEHEESELADY